MKISRSVLYVLITELKSFCESYHQECFSGERKIRLSVTFSTRKLRQVLTVQFPE
jgi:hypothetical protein